MNDCVSPSPCLNGGACIDGVNAVNCDCSGTGFFGPRCATGEFLYVLNISGLIVSRRLKVHIVLVGTSISQSASSSYHSCAVLYKGVLKCWGWNNYGQLGLGDTLNRGVAPTGLGSALPKVDVGSGRTVQSVGSGGTAE